MDDNHNYYPLLEFLETTSKNPVITIQDGFETRWLSFRTYPNGRYYVVHKRRKRSVLLYEGRHFQTALECLKTGMILREGLPDITAEQGENR